jgi:hypothetical protein
MFRRVVCPSLLVLTPICAAAAQGTTLGTGTTASGGFDQRWDVACRTLTAGSTSAACDGAASMNPTFYDAAIVTVAPSGWATAGTLQGGSYISRVADASLRAGVGNELENFEYTYRTSFNIAAGSPSDYLINLTRLRFDNYWGGYRLNGGAVQLGGLTSDMGGPTGVGTENWTRDFALRIDNGFQAGTNTLELVFTGNGVNDGIFVQGEVVAVSSPAALVTPEPSTYLLTASGLIGLALAARRRRIS